MNTLTGEIVLVFNSTDTLGLKQGQPSFFIETEASAKLFEEPTLFLHEQFVRSGTSPSVNTWAAAAQALKTWFQYLQAVGIGWRDAGANDRRNYRDAYLSAISPRTGRKYSPVTVASRMAVTSQFYLYARKKAWYDGDIGGPSEIIVASGTSIDRDSLAHTRSLGRFKSRDRDLPKRTKDKVIRALSVTDLKALLNYAGPQANTCNGDPRTSRDRLIFDFGWAVGLRLDEVAGLTTLQFLSLTPDPVAPASSLPLVICGKGRKFRQVAVPTWLVQDTLAYIDDERLKTMRRANIKTQKTPIQLFLGAQESTRRGRPITRKRIQGIMEEACTAIGLVEYIEVVDPDNGERLRRKRARYSFHDLRHTYAVLTYHAERLLGNAEPWKKIQAQLGHEHLGTTIDTYLAHVEIFGETGGLLNVRKIIGL